MHRYPTLIAAVLSAGLAVAADSPTRSIDPSALVKPSDTAIDAIIAVETAVEAELAKDTNAVVTVLPLAADGARNAAFNREFQFLTDGKKVVWGGTPEPNLWARREEGSHLFRTEGPRTKPVRWWYNRMKERRDIIRSSSGEFDFVMISDSLGHRWDNEPFFTEFTNTYSFLNLGYGGDKAETAIWRAENGELDGYRAKLVCIQIGSNNQRKDDTVERTAEFIRKLIGIVRAKQPQAKIVLEAIMPVLLPFRRGELERNDAVSEVIRNFADGKDVFWLDHRKCYFKPDGTGRFDLLGDGNHPGISALRLWRDQLMPYLVRCTGKRYDAGKDRTLPPLARRWFYCRADLSKDASAAEALVARAGGFGYNGVLLDAFDGVGGWDGAARTRFVTLRTKCRAAGVEIIPVVYQQPADAFRLQAEKVNALCAPAKWFVTTNRIAYAKENCYVEQAKVLKADLDVLKALTPDAERIAMATDFDGRGGLLPKDLTLATAKGHPYFERDDWPLMALVPIDEKGREYWVFRAWAVKKTTPKGGVIYWTDGGDYTCLEDVSRMAEQRW